MSQFSATLYALVLAVSSVSAMARPLSDEVDALFANFGEHTPGCSIRIDRQGARLLSNGYGIANLEHQIPIVSHSRFYIASASKQFTALAAALLIRDGELSLKDRVREFIPVLPAYADAVTVENLIHHTDGFRDYFTLLYFQGRDYNDALLRNEIVSLITAQSALNFEPGTEFLYSNTGYLLLAMIVEQVSGKRLKEFATERIFAPLGMNDTSYVDDFRDIIPGRAEGYVFDNGSWISPRSRYAEIGPSGVVSTVIDLAKWLEALRSNFFGESFTRSLFTKGTLANDTPVNYGFGFFLEHYRGISVVHHGGARPEYFSNIALVPELDLGIVLLCNHGAIDTISTTNAIIELLADPGRLKTRNEIDLQEEEQLDVIGTYAFENGSRFVVSREGEQTFAQADGEAKYPIYPSSPDVYFYKVADIELFFARQGESVGSLTMKMGTTQNLARKIHPTAEHSDERQLHDFAGEYWSGELATTYQVAVRNSDNTLVIRLKNGELLALAEISPGAFRAPGIHLTFERNTEEKVVGLRASAQRVRNLRFAKKL